MNRSALNLYTGYLLQIPIYGNDGKGGDRSIANS
jgi:hypothetical protein